MKNHLNTQQSTCLLQAMKNTNVLNILHVAWHKMLFLFYSPQPLGDLPRNILLRLRIQKSKNLFSRPVVHGKHKHNINKSSSQKVDCIFAQPPDMEQHCYSVLEFCITPFLSDLLSNKSLGKYLVYECSSPFTNQSLIFSVCCLVAGQQCSMGLSELSYSFLKLSYSFLKFSENVFIQLYHYNVLSKFQVSAKLPQPDDPFNRAPMIQTNYKDDSVIPRASKSQQLFSPFLELYGIQMMYNTA